MKTKRQVDPILFVAIIFVFGSLLIFSIIPLLKILLESFFTYQGNFSLSAYGKAFTSTQNLHALENTLLLGVTSGIIATAVGYLFAYCASYVKMKNKKVFNLVALLPIVSPPFAVALSLILLFGSRGLITYTFLGLRDINIYGFKGILFAQVLSYFPISYLLLTAVLSEIDPSIEEAARNIGASRWSTFKDIILPLTIPGIANSFLLVFIKSVADFGNPITIGGNYPTLATQIYFQAIGNYDMQGGAAVAMLLLLISMGLYVFSKYFISSKSYVTITGKATRERVLINEPHIRLPLNGICYFISFVVISFYILIPLVSFTKLWGINYTPTFDNYIYAWKIGKEGLKDATLMAAIATPITGVLAMIVAYLVVRRRFKGRKTMEFISMLGMTVPGTVMGIGFVLSFNAPPFVLTGTLMIMVISCVIRYLPIGVQSGVTALRQIDPSIEEAAADLGANSYQVFTTVTLPLIKNAFFGGLVYTFVKSMTTVSAVIFLISANYKLLTVSILDQVNTGKFGVASAMSTMLIIVVYIAIGVLYFVMGRLGINKKDIKLV